MRPAFGRGYLEDAFQNIADGLAPCPESDIIQR
jgi:hypothetical protein